MTATWSNKRYIKHPLPVLKKRINFLSPYYLIHSSYHRGGKTERLRLVQGYTRTESNNLNIIEGINHVIFDYSYIAKRWSSESKGRYIQLSDDDTKAGITGRASIRADFGITRGEITCWEFEIYQKNRNHNFYGVISSQQTDFNACPYDRDNFRYAYGIDDRENRIYLNGKETRLNSWTKPALPYKTLFTLQMVADWRDCKQCKLLCINLDRNDQLSYIQYRRLLDLSPNKTVNVLLCERIGY